MLPWSLLVFIAIVALVAMTGAINRPGVWYQGLKKPFWTPPKWVFPVVWTTLYVLIAIAGWLVWSTAGFSAPLIFWALQAILNGAWSWLFFGRKRMGLALGDVSALWLSIAGFIVTAWPLSQNAALLFVPYLLWVTIAAALNATLIKLNPEEFRKKALIV